MLRSRMFKDTVLGDGGADASSTDIAVFSGNLSDYTLVALDANGAAVVSPHANWASVVAIKVTDNRDPNAVDANGVLIPTDGTDLIVGVESFRFADQTIAPEAYFDVAPVVDLNYAPGIVQVASDNFSGGGNAYARGAGWATDWAESGDNVSANSGQIEVTGGGGAALRFDTGDGASILRTLDLTGRSSATVSYTVVESGFDGTETVTVSFSADGVSFATLETIDLNTNNGGTHQFTVNAPIGGFSASAVLRFAVSNVVANGGGATNNPTVTIDNIVISSPGDTSAGNNFSTAYTENAAGSAIASSPVITDVDDALIYSARVVLRDGIAGDRLNVGALPANISAVGAGTGIVVLSSLAGSSKADFQAALAAVTFSSTSDNPTNAARHIDVTVSDGLKDSAIATTTVSVTPVDDPTTAAADDLIITNYGTGNNAAFTVPDWALTANDTDLDVAVIAGVNGALGLANNSPTHSNNNQNVTIQDAGAAGGSFRYYFTAQTSEPDITQNSSNRPTVTVTQDTTGALDGTANADIIVGNGADSTINGNGGNDIIFGGGGNDIVLAGAGDDTVVWNAGQGRDRVDGGTEIAAGDTFVVNGDGSAETYRVYARADALLAGLTGLDAATEIVITRNGTNNASIIAELTEVEEIVINTGGGNDTVTPIGNFNPTNLAFNTIHINNEGGNVVVDVTGLESEHRTVLTNYNGGTGQIDGQRSQDIEQNDGPPAMGACHDDGHEHDDDDGIDACDLVLEAPDVILDQPRDTSGGPADQIASVIQYLDPNDIENWSLVQDSLNTDGVRLRQDIQYDDGSSQAYHWDANDTRHWSEMAEFRDADGNRYRQNIYHDNGADTFYFWDETDQHTWTEFREDFNADGERTTQRVYNDDGTYTFQHWDTNDTKSWTTYVEKYDATGLVEQQYYLDSQQLVRILHDTTDSESWSTMTKLYDASGDLIDVCKIKDHDFAA